MIDDIEAALSYPVFTKPARQGSSIGIRRCTTREEVVAGIEEAFGYDRIAIIEEGLDDIREIECGVIGNTAVEVTRPGEMVHAGEFYDFEAKYVSAVELRCPSDLPDVVTRLTMEYAKEAYLAIGCRGMARVDFFFLERSGQVLVNEINTIPGMTSQSMFWVVWEAEGLARSALLDRLLALAFEATEAEARFAP